MKQPKLSNWQTVRTDGSRVVSTLIRKNTPSNSSPSHSLKSGGCPTEYNQNTGIILPYQSNYYISYSTVTCRVLLNRPNSKLGQHCIYRCYIVNQRINKLLLQHNLFSGATHIPLSSQRPFHIFLRNQKTTTNIL